MFNFSGTLALIHSKKCALEPKCRSGNFYPLNENTKQQKCDSIVHLSSQEIIITVVKRQKIQKQAKATKQKELTPIKVYHIHSRFYIPPA